MKLIFQFYHLPNDLLPMVKIYKFPFICRLFISSLTVVFFICTSHAQITLNPAFNASDRGFGFGDGFNGAVTAVKFQPDGKVLVGGSFSKYNGAPRFGIARLKGNNRGLDSTFGDFSNYGVSGGNISQFAIQPDGKIIVVGSFIQFGSSLVNRVVRLNTDGTQDFGFLTGSGADSTIFGVDIQPDGKIILAGNFRFFNGSNRSSVVRLLPNGTVDISFNAGFGGPGTGGGVRGVKVLSDGKILVCGDFRQTFNQEALVPANESHYVIRLLANGQKDPAFITPYGGTGVANAMDITTSAQIVIGGDFSTILGAGRQYVARLQSDGSLDPAFSSPFSSGEGSVFRLMVIPGDNVVLAGFFSSVNGTKRGSLARIQTNGSLDAGFAVDSSADGPVLAIDRDASGKFVIGGFFRRFDETQRRNIARISALGLVDLPFSQNTGADDIVYSMALQPNGRIILGGDFGYFNWNKRNGVVKLLPNGQNDPSFLPGKGANGAVRSVLFQPDKKILVAGRFNSFNNLNRRGIVRLDSTGVVDSGFLPGLGANDTIWTMALYNNGKILLGGDFTLFNGQPAPGIVRLNSNGTIDNTFQPGTGFNGRVRVIKIYQDSIIFAGGVFSSCNGLPRNGIARLDDKGRFKSGSNLGPGVSAGGTVLSIAFLSGGQVMVGGLFSQYNGQNRRNLIRMAQNGQFDPAFDSSPVTDGPVRDMFTDQATGQITAAGDFDDGNKGIGRNGIIRLKPSGARNLGFNTGTGTNDPVNVVLDNGDEILIGGEFTGFDGSGRNRVASLNDDPQVYTVWDGTAWDIGPPSSTLSAFIDGPYNGAGFTTKDLTVLPGESLTASSDIEVYGNGTNLSISTISGTVVMKGSSAQTWKGKIQNLTIDNAAGVSLDDQTLLTGTLKLQTGQLISGGNLVLVSNASGTARLAKVEPSAALIGDVTIQRFVPGNTIGWFLIGTPVENQTLSDWSDDFTITDNTLFLHNEGGTVNNGLQINGWEYSPPSVSVGRGYRAYLNQPFFNSNPTFSNTGPIVTGNKSFSVSYSPMGYGGGGWNLLANPYPCEVDFNSLIRSNIGGELHIWNHVYEAYGSYSIGTGLSVFDVDRYIASGQGFFVKATATSPALQITEDAKPLSPVNASFIRIAAQDPPDAGRFRLKNSNGERDEVAIRWMAQAGPQFEPEYDANKFGNGPAGITLFSKTQEGIRASIQGRYFEDADSVFFGYNVENPGNYFFEINLGDDIFNGKVWVLKDLETGFAYPVATSQFVYPFEIISSSMFSSNRFLLVGKIPVQVSKPIEKQAFVFPNPGLNKLRITGLKGTEKILIQDVQGKNRIRERANGRENLDIFTEEIKSGLYLIVIESGTEKQVLKWIKQ